MTPSDSPGRPSPRLSHVLLGLVVSAMILFFFAREIDLAAMRAEFKRVDWRYVPPLAAGLLLMQWMRTARWRILLPRSFVCRFGSLLDAVLAGFAATFVLPLRAGELVRPWLLTRWEHFPFSTLLATILTERVLDALALMLCLGFCLLQFASPPAPLVLGARILLVTSGGLLGLILVCYARPDWIRRAFAALRRRFAHGKDPAPGDRWMGLLDNVLAGLRGLSSPRELLLAVVWSLALWVFIGFWYQAVFWALGLHPHYWAGTLVTVVVAVAVAAPSAPGFIGTFQAGCILAIAGLLTYSAEFAAAYSLVAHGIQALAAVMAGLIVGGRRMWSRAHRGPVPPAVAM